MKKINHEEVFFNRSAIADATQINCDECFEELIFALEDRNHNFSIGMTTILECLEFAENNGDIPKLPNEWWLAVKQRYRKLSD